MSLTELLRPITRLVGGVVVRIGPEGLTLRGYRRRNGVTYSWQQLASLSGDDTPITREAERTAGARILEQLTRPRRRRRRCV